MNVYLVIGHFACFGDDCLWNVAVFTDKERAESWCAEAKKFADRIYALCEKSWEGHAHATSVPQEFGDLYHKMDMDCIGDESSTEEDLKASMTEWGRLQDMFRYNLNPFDHKDSAMQWIRERCPIEYRVHDFELDPPLPQTLHQEITPENTPLLARQVAEADYKKLQELWDLSPEQRFETYDPEKDDDF